MPIILIEEVSIDANNRLFVRPRLLPTEDFEFIYRDATGIFWINNIRSLGAREPHRWEHIDLFKQILTAMQSEYGISLAIGEDTRWINIPAELHKQLLEIGTTCI